MDACCNTECVLIYQIRSVTLGAQCVSPLLSPTPFLIPSSFLPLLLSPSINHSLLPLSFSLSCPSDPISFPIKISHSFSYLTVPPFPPLSHSLPLLLLLLFLTYYWYKLSDNKQLDEFPYGIQAEIFLFFWWIILPKQTPAYIFQVTASLGLHAVQKTQTQTHVVLDLLVKRCGNEFPLALEVANHR